MNTERAEELLDRMEAVDLTELVNLPPEEFEEHLQDVADAQRELLTGITDQIMRQMRGGS